MKRVSPIVLLLSYPDDEAEMQHNDTTLAHKATALRHNTVTLRHQDASGLRHKRA